ncbi:hypothetical protein [Kiloniella litopenaei]|uniref:hypothetical protein n=1 Tax=Kiloniella litopenaei TaxID=1549748 RepID=UPI003BA97E5A
MSKNLVLNAFELGACYTIDELAGMLDISRKAISTSAARLILDDYLVRREIGCYEITEKGAQAKADGIKFTSGPKGEKRKPSLRKRRTLKDNIWAALRIKRKATIEDLLFVGEIEGRKSSRSNALNFLTKLQSVGVVRKLPRKVPGEALTSNGFNRYLLVKDLGPETPYFRAKIGKVYDPNSKTYLGDEE